MAILSKPPMSMGNLLAGVMAHTCMSNLTCLTAYVHVCALVI
jgi:hypothetical protein